MQAHFCAFAIVLLSLLHVATSAIVWDVISGGDPECANNQCGTIGDAFSYANPGDIISIHPGNYEIPITLDFAGKENLFIQGAYPQEKPFLECVNGNSVAIRVPANNVGVLSWFKIRGCDTAIESSGDSTVIKNIDFQDNGVSVNFTNAGLASITNCTVTGAKSGSISPQIIIMQTGTTTLKNITLTDITNNASAAIHARNSYPDVRDITCSKNSVTCIFVEGASSTIVFQKIQCLNNRGICLHMQSNRVRATAEVLNSLFVNNTSPVLVGAAIYFNHVEGHLTLLDSVFSGNVAPSGGAIYSVAPLSITRCDFFNNSASGSGGAIYFNMDISLNTCNFTGNSANWGGALFFSTSAPNSTNITTSTFFFNKANNGAAAIYIRQGYGVIRDSIFSHNDVRSGALLPNVVYLEESGMQFVNCTFDSNLVPDIYANSESSKNVTIHGSTFLFSPLALKFNLISAKISECNFQSNGNSLVAFNSNITIQSATLNGNLLPAIILEGCNFNDSNNHYISSGGGAVFAKNCGNLNFQNSHFWYTNRSAIMLENSVALLLECEFQSCSTESNDGSALTITSRSNVTTNLCQFNDNIGTFGAIKLASGNYGDLTSSFARNVGGFLGGALFLNSSFYLSGTNLGNNRAPKGGGAYIGEGANGLMINCIIEGNIAEAGPGLYLDAAVRIESGTINTNIGLNDVDSGIYFGTPAAEQNSTVKTTLLSNFSPFRFCCNNSAQHEFLNLECDYPSCSEGCGGTESSCNCESIPAAPCSCPSGLTGPYCNIPGMCLGNECGNNSRCIILTLDTYMCQCMDGYIGANGINCTRSLSCANNTCSENEICRDGSCICLPGSNCTVRDRCNINNGGCDKRASCLDSQGTLICGPCPRGFGGSGYNTCYPLCGDRVCDAAVGENCVTCSEDCRAASCDVCGDNVCSGTETCENCFSDCKDKCKPQCRNCIHGTCVSASTCSCDPGWAGPNCNDRPIPITVDTNQTSPNAVVTTPSNSQGSRQFGISVKSITEYSINGAPIFSVDLDTINFTKSRDVAATSDELWRYKATLANNADLNISFIQVNNKDGSTFQVKTVTLYFPAGTLKINVAVYNWPFMAISNTLQIQFEVNVIGGGETCERAESNGHDSIAYTSITLDGNTLYTKFQPEAVIDDRLRHVTYAAVTNRSVIATVPHFWKFAELDPDFVVLLDSSGCSDPRNRVSTKVIVAVVVPVAAVIILGGLAIYFYRQHMINKRNKLLLGRLGPSESERPLKSSSSSNTNSVQEMDDLNIQKRNDMEVTTASGRYTVNM